MNDQRTNNPQAAMPWRPVAELQAGHYADGRGDDGRVFEIYCGLDRTIIDVRTGCVLRGITGFRRMARCGLPADGSVAALGPQQGGLI